MTCAHATTRQIGADRPFSGPVYTHRITDEWPPAYGNVECTEECVSCGAQRLVLINQQHREVSAWGPTYAERCASERAESERREAADRERGRAVLARIRSRVVGLDGDDVIIDTDGLRARVWSGDLRAAGQYDDDTGAAYRELVRQAKEVRS